jgi:chromosome segregation ATPase
VSLWILQQSVQAAIDRAGNPPNWWPVSFVGAVLAVILSTWTLLGRISARFNKALDDKLGPLATQIKVQGERSDSESKRLESHFDAAIREYEDNARAEITQIANSLRAELKIAVDKHNELALAVTHNRANIDQHNRELHESKVDRAAMHREMDAVRSSLAAFDVGQQRSEEKILDAIAKTRERLETNQADLGTRTTRVEEALKYYGGGPQRQAK